MCRDLQVFRVFTGIKSIQKEICAFHVNSKPSTCLLWAMLSAESCLQSVCHYFPGHGSPQKVMLLSMLRKGGLVCSTWPSWSLFSAPHSLQGQSRERQWQIYGQKPFTLWAYSPSYGYFAIPLIWACIFEHIHNKTWLITLEISLLLHLNI